MGVGELTWATEASGPLPSRRPKGLSAVSRDAGLQPATQGLLVSCRIFEPDSGWVAGSAGRTWRLVAASPPNLLSRVRSEHAHYLCLMHMYLWTLKEARCRNARLAAAHGVLLPMRVLCNILWKFTLKEISNPND